MARNRSPQRAGDAGEGRSRTRRHFTSALGLLAVGIASAGTTSLVLWLKAPESHALPQRDSRAVDLSRTFRGAKGAWGRIEYTRISIGVPEEYVAAADQDASATWKFPGYSVGAVLAQAGAAGLTATELGQLQRSQWEVHLDGVTVRPAPELVRGLEPRVRSRLYEMLANLGHNEPHRFPQVFYPEFLDERLESSGVAPQTLERFRKLLYPRGSWLLFSDPSAVMADLGKDERLRFEKMLYRRVTHTASLLIDKDSDIDAMVAYWTYPGRAKGLRPLFESVARVPGGGTLDIAHVLPPFARKRIFTYPESSSDSVAKRRDCVWSSFNFFNETPDDRFTDPSYTGRVLKTQYEEVPASAPRFGDLVAFMGENGSMAHVSVYLADGLVFTKNGATATQPWMFMPLGALHDLYSVVRPDRLSTVFYRRKG